MMDRVDSLFLGVLAVLTIVYLALFGYYLQATAIRVPVYDLLGWILHYADTWQHGDWWGYLWQPHNEHRLIFTRLLLLADIAWFRGTTLPFMIFSLVCLGGMIALIMWEVAASKLPANLKLTLVLCVPLLLATTYIVVDCSMPALGASMSTQRLSSFLRSCFWTARVRKVGSRDCGAFWPCWRRSAPPSELRAG